MQWSYIAFLGVLSYFVLTELQPFRSLSSITLCEWILVVWFVSHIVEELTQVPTETVMGKRDVIHKTGSK